MKVQILINLTDQMSEQELNAAGFTIERLCKIYEGAILGFLQEGLAEGLEAGVRATATDNTKEVQNPESRWELILDNYKAGLYGNPGKAETMRRYWEEMAAADYPNASENVKYFEDANKQIPKKPTYVDTRFRNHGRHVRDGCSLDKCYKCPSCWSHIFHVFDSEKYCIHCGQALDWGEEAPKNENQRSQ